MKYKWGPVLTHCGPTINPYMGHLWVWCGHPFGPHKVSVCGPPWPQLLEPIWDLCVYIMKIYMGPT